MGFLKGIKDAIASGGNGPSLEALASLTPEQRSKYDAKMAQLATVQAQTQESKRETDSAHAAGVAQRPLQGPAGEWVYGAAATAGLSPEQIGALTTTELRAASTSNTKEQFKDLLKNPFGIRTPPPAPMAPPSGPVDRQRQAALERAARDADRQPYLAELRSPVVFSRLATRGGTQIQEVAAYLASTGLAARPDLVYGVYRVPDRISPAIGGSEDERVVEWEVIHAATTALSPAASVPSAVFFDGSEQWVRRSVGEPSVLDEDLGVAYLAAAGVGPEQTLGIARHLIIQRHTQGEDSTSDPIVQVAGMHVLHPSGPGAAALDQIRHGRPIDLPMSSAPGVHVEALNWGAVAHAVHPEHHRAYTVPSPFPYLPSTAQELALMYLEVVGVRPSDCYATSVTEDGPRALGGEELRAGGFIEWTTTYGDPLPCADGKARRRLAGGLVVIVAYRDKPQYETGRARWADYQHNVLQAALERGNQLRKTVEQQPLDRVPDGLRQILKAAYKIDNLISSDGARKASRELSPHRYCWPPTPR